MSFNGDCNKTPTHCKGCIYRQTEGISVCGYSLKTGKLRGCPVDECTHYIPAYSGSHKRAYNAMKRKKAEECIQH